MSLWNRISNRICFPDENILDLKREKSELLFRVLKLESKVLQLKSENLHEYIRYQINLNNLSSKTISYPRWIKENLMFLIRACHPDKHNNSTESTIVTQNLLELRRK